MLLTSAASAAGVNVTGAWEVTRTCITGQCAGTSVHYVFSLAQMQGSSNVSGTISRGSESGATVTGSVSGNSMTLTARSPNGYEATGNVTITPEGKSWSGGYTDNRSSTGSISATLLGEPAPSTPAGLEATATAVSCTYVVAQIADTCTATVGDATGKGVTPTGTVTFTGSPGSSFLGSSACTLAQTSGGVGVASCSIQFTAPESLTPEIKASYPGDAQHGPSVASTNYLFAAPGNSVEAPTIPKYVLSSLEVEVSNPVAGSTLGTTATLTEGSIAQCAAPGASSSSARASTLSKRHPFKLPHSLSARSVIRNARAGRVDVRVHFTPKALRRAFPHARTLQLLVIVTIKPPHGHSIQVARREVVKLRVSHGRARLSTAHLAASSSPIAVASAVRSYSGKGPCTGEEFTLTVEPAPNEPAPRKATLTGKYQATCTDGVQRLLAFTVDLAEISGGGVPLFKGRGTSTAAEAAAGPRAAIVGKGGTEFGGGVTCTGEFQVILH
jgi:hypothetical protein